jgi:hypothetical protein
MSSSFKNTRIQDTGFLKLPVGTTAQRPSVSNGQLRYNSTLGYSEYYTPATANGSAGWAPVVENKTYVNDASGGSISYDALHKKHTFIYDLIYCDNTTSSYTHATDAAVYANGAIKRLRAPHDGTLTLMWDGYIQSGPRYWVWRIKRTRASGSIDYFPDTNGHGYGVVSRTNSSAGFDYGWIPKNDHSDLLEAGTSAQHVTTSPNTHIYGNYIYENLSVRAGDLIELEFTSGNGGSVPVTGQNQVLYAKNFKVYQTEYIFKPAYSGYVEVLCVGGGGGGGAYAAGGGGGAGGLVYRPYYWVTAGTEYTVKVGRGGFGGWAQSTAAQNGANSQFGTDLIALGGGRGGVGWEVGTSTALDGGSGGGSQGWDGTSGTSYSTGGGGPIDGAGASLINGQGSRGGRGKGVGGNNGAGGGGGGAGRFGLDASDTNGGNGGQGYGLSIQKRIGGTVYGLAAGGGGASYQNTQGTGGSGGGGPAAASTYLGQNWPTDTHGGHGGGGGRGAGADIDVWGGAGSTGLVVVRYVAVKPKTSLVFFTGSRWEVPAGVTSVEVLCVGGGGGGGYDQGGGGGAGGVVYSSNVPVTPGQVYNIRIGQAGAGSSSSSAFGSSGGNTSFSLTGGGGYNSGIIAFGGGGGGSLSARQGQSGASGGGSAGSNDAYSKLSGGQQVYGAQGFDGGAGNRYAGGGGGGAGGAGENSKIVGSSLVGFGGNGGPGLPLTITGSLYVYACGGAGCGAASGGRGGRGGDYWSTGAYGGRGAGNSEAGGNGQTYGSGGGGGHTTGTGGSGVQGICVVRF